MKVACPVLDPPLPADFTCIRVPLGGRLGGSSVRALLGVAQKRGF